MVIKCNFQTAFESNLPCSHNSDVLGTNKFIKYFRHHPDLSPCTMLFYQELLAVKDPGMPFLLPDQK